MKEQSKTDDKADTNGKSVETGEKSRTDNSDKTEKPGKSEKAGKTGNGAKSERADSTQSAEERAALLETGSITAGPFSCISIIGQVEGHFLLDSTQKTTKYEHLLPMLVSLEQDAEVRGVLVLLNTMGGDVEAGLALAEMIASMSKPTATLVLGGGHSIGIPLAVSASRSFIVESATMTIHPVRSNGTVIGVPQSFYYFEKMQERILGFIVSHCKADKAELRRMMMNTDEIANDVGSIIDGKLAVEIGLIDEIGGIKEALAWLSGAAGAKTPR